MTARADEIHTFLHCRKCTLGGQTERLEVGITRSGIRVDCRKHGLVGHFTAEQVAEWVAKGIRCECCPGGMHRS